MRQIFTHSILALLISLLAFPVLAQPQHAKSILGPWDGEWRGVFRIFHFDGTPMDSLTVHQKYYWEGSVQKGIITDTYSDGRVEVSHAENYLRNDTLYCVVRKPNGETTVHRGTHAGGRLTWWRRLPEQGISESFKEYVAGTPRGTIYFIDGVGLYGTGPQPTVLLFEGRYRKQ